MEAVAGTVIVNARELGIIENVADGETVEPAGRPLKLIDTEPLKPLIPAIEIWAASVPPGGMDAESGDTVMVKSEPEEESFVESPPLPQPGVRIRRKSKERANKHADGLKWPPRSRIDAANSISFGIDTARLRSWIGT